MTPEYILHIMEHGWWWQRWYIWYLAFFHLDDVVVCELSNYTWWDKDVGLFHTKDYHDYYDSEEGQPMHFHTYTCVRCGKKFTI